MGPGQGPPKVIATQRSDVWDVLGALCGLLVLRDARPEGRVPKNLVGEVAERRGAVGAAEAAASEADTERELQFAASKSFALRLDAALLLPNCDPELH